MQERFESDYLPTLPLRDMVVFPGTVTPLFVVRSVSLSALDAAMGRDKKIFLACQKEGGTEEPGANDLFTVGTVAEVLQVLRVPDGSAKILVEGHYAARVVEFNDREKALHAFVVLNQVSGRESKAVRAHMRTAGKAFEKYAALTDKIPAELFASIRGITDPLAYIHAVTNYSTIGTLEKQHILEANSLEEKYILFMQHMDAENQILELERKIAGQVKTQIGKSQREYYLNEQLKAIERELGLGADEDPELQELSDAIHNAGLPQEALEKAEKELNRLIKMAPMSPEAVVTRTYLEWLTEVPWNDRTQDDIDLEEARKILDRDHYGLKKIKERILEYLAVVKLAGQGRGPILCFVGPPGVGKTSLGVSIAECMKRHFVRISLGGVRDEAEIRGHRRTYVGALPGKIIQSMKRAGTINPVFLLDEIDKMSSDFRGDPASALLEVLDPAQNKTFVDHYLETEYDLSNVTFLTTANSLESIPYPLLDRMELIRLSGYTEDEKYHIAKRHLLPRQRKEHGLKSTQITVTKPVLMKAITAYTREAGVRELDRTLAAICRKVTVQAIESPKKKNTRVTMEKLHEFLGPERYTDSPIDKKPEIGSAIGLAWTEAGGELLPVETTPMRGGGSLLLTGKLGEVMQESAKAALSYVRSKALDLGIDPEFYESTDIHIHVPEGAIPKDGPSAGITIATSLASALSHIPIRQDVAMTGEITLRGRVLRIGGLKEKALAAHRSNIKTIIIPKENVKDIDEIASDIRKDLKFVPVERLDEVLEVALIRPKGDTRRGRRTPAPPSGSSKGIQRPV